MNRHVGEGLEAPAVEEGGGHVLRRQWRQTGDAAKRVAVTGKAFLGVVVDGCGVKEESDATRGVGEVIVGGDF